MAREIVEADRRSRRIFWAVAGALALGALAVWPVLFFAGGREYRPRFCAKYLREVPEGLTAARSAQPTTSPPKSAREAASLPSA